MAKSIADIAEELGVGADVIIKKCASEGIPLAKISGPASAVSSTLEAAIREWLSDEGGQDTAQRPHQPNQ